MTAVWHSLYIAQRHVRGLIRQPWYIAFTLLQPIMWLVLYSQLFKRVTDLPGFNTASYITFLTPGIIVSSALFSGGWSGMGVIVDIDKGVMDRLLVSPVSRVAIMAGRLAQMAAVSVVQSLVLLALGFVLGARYAGGAGGLIVLLLSGVLLCASFGALSNAMALVMRKPESVIGASNFVLLPLTFLSPIYMARDLMPFWMRAVAPLNPVTWSAEAARAAISGQADWKFVATRLGLLVLFTIGSLGLATRAFRAYQQSV